MEWMEWNEWPDYAKKETNAFLSFFQSFWISDFSLGLMNRTVRYFRFRERFQKRKISSKNLFTFFDAFLDVIFYWGISQHWSAFRLVNLIFKHFPLIAAPYISKQTFFFQNFYLHVLIQSQHFTQSVNKIQVSFLFGKWLSKWAFVWNSIRAKKWKFSENNFF